MTAVNFNRASVNPHPHLFNLQRDRCVAVARRLRLCSQIRWISRAKLV